MSAFRGNPEDICSHRVLLSLVESRCGAVALGRTYLLPPLSSGGASMVPPWLRFHIPLIGRVEGWRAVVARGSRPTPRLQPPPTPSEIPRPCHVSSPRHVERSMRISRTALPHLLHVEAYETYPAGATFGSAYSIVPSGSPIAPEHTYV